MPDTLTKAPPGDASGKVQFGNFDIMNDAEGRPLSLGKGTFGRTYQARHRFLDTVVALKIINERYAMDAAVRQRFLVEARAVARLTHPHVARLYDFGEVDGVLHYAMEYCGGGSLADYVAKRGPLDLNSAIQVGQQIAGALKCAHTAGFIHRDLKPSNIMLTEGQGALFTKLIDFGLVQPSLPEATLDAEHSADGARFLGTPLFASPEQLKEEPMDIRTDLFSLGMTIWYLLLGRAPDAGSSAEVAASRLSPASYAARLPAEWPPQMRDTLARLLEKDRKNRYASAAEVFAAFNACANALGFRKARDYTSSGSEPTEWEEAEPSREASSSPSTEPIEVERVEADLSSEFNIVTRINDDFTGANYVAESTKESGLPALLHVLNPAIVQDSALFTKLRLHLAHLRSLELPEVLQPKALRSYSDYVSIVLDKPTGIDLMSVLRTERVVLLVQAAPLLERIADTCDQLAATGLPGVQLAPGHIYLEWPDEGDAPAAADKAHQLSKAVPRLYPRFLAVSEAPEFARMEEPEDVSSTMTTDMLGDPSRADNMVEHFGSLLYRIVAGRNCPVAASLSSQAYVPAPSLGEQSNRLLGLVIAKQIERSSCGQVLREILGAEGIVPRSPAHPSAGFTGPGTGSTVAPPGATPSPTRTPAKSSTASGSSRSWVRPVPVIPPAPVIPPPVAPIEATGTSAAAPPKPPASPVEAKESQQPPPIVKETSAPPATIPEIAITAKTQPLGSPPSTPSVEPKPAPLITPAPAESKTEKTGPVPPAVTRKAKKIEQPKAPPSTPTPAPAVAKEPKVVSRPESLPAIPAIRPTPFVAKSKADDLEDAQEKTFVEPPTKTVLSRPDADSFVTEKIVRRAAPPVSPQTIVPSPPAVTQPTIFQNAIPWARKNVRPIVIGAAALLVLSVSYATIQKIRSRNATTETVTVAPKKEPPAVNPVKENTVSENTASASVAASPSRSDGEEEKIKTEKALAERTAEEQKQKSADEAKLAEQKAAEEAKLLAERSAEQQKQNQNGPTKLAPGPESAANTKTQEAPKTRTTQKPTQKEPSSSQRSNTTSQSSNRSAPVTAPRSAPVQRPANTQRPRSEFGPSAPGG